MLPSLVYLTLCRSIQLLAQLARGAAKALEILVLRHQLAVLSADGFGVPGWNRPTEPCSRRQPRPAKS